MLTCYRAEEPPPTEMRSVSSGSGGVERGSRGVALVAHCALELGTRDSRMAPGAWSGHSSARAAALVLHLKLYLNVNERL